MAGASFRPVRGSNGCLRQPPNPFTQLLSGAQAQGSIHALPLLSAALRWWWWWWRWVRSVELTLSDPLNRGQGAGGTLPFQQNGEWGWGWAGLALWRLG